MRPFVLFPVDEDSRAFWEGVARHEFLVQRCPCGTLRWPPRAVCSECGSFDWEEEPASGDATVVSWMVNRHPFSPVPESPYTVVLARLAEHDGILVPAWWGGLPDGVDLAVGMAVRLDFVDLEPGEPDRPRALLVWRPGSGPAVPAP